MKKSSKGRSRPRTVFVESPRQETVAVKSPKQKRVAVKKNPTTVPADWADNTLKSWSQKWSSGEWKEFGIADFDCSRRSTITSPEQVKKDFVDFQTLDKVRVICRLRPSSTLELREEKQRGLEQVEPLIEGQVLSVPRDKEDASGRSGRRNFVLDGILDWKSSQNRCFRVIGFPMVQSVLEGYNATVFAYGQTGSGKSYTMFGPEGGKPHPQQIGLVQRAISVIFKSLKQRENGSKYSGDSLIGSSVRVQFVQIYKEQLFDLLNPKSGANLRIRYDPRTSSPYIENITQNVVHNTKEVLTLTKIAISNRITDKTGMNNVSSRSHLIMTIFIEQQKHDGTKVSSKLNFGDLAGTESVRKTKVKVGSKQFTELKAINLSLSQLTTVINDIVHNRRPAFRASKLTYLLQDSLGGNTKTTIVVCGSPHIFNRDETVRTLKFAQSAKAIKNKAKINKEYTGDRLMKVVQNLEAEIQKYKSEVARLERQIGLAGKTEKTSSKPGMVKFDQVNELEVKMELLASKAKDRTEDLENQLNLKAVELDKCLLEVQMLQNEKLRFDAQNEQNSKRMKELEDNLNTCTSEVDVMYTEIERKRMIIENLKFQLLTAETEMKKLRAEFRVTLEQKNDELTSSVLANEDLMDQIINLKTKVYIEHQARLRAEQTILNLSSKTRWMCYMQDENMRRGEREMTALQREADELKREKDQLDLSLREKEFHYQKLNRTLKDSNVDLQIALKEAQEEVCKKTLTAQEILDKFAINEGVLKGIESDLGAVLHTWKNRKRKRKKRKTRAPNPNTTIAFQIRSLIAYFNIAMGQLKEYEDQAGEQDIRNARLKKMERKNFKLEEYIKKLEETIAKQRRIVMALKKENKRAKSSSKALLNGGHSPCDEEMLMYLEDYSGAALRGDEIDDDNDLNLIHVDLTQKDELHWEQDLPILETLGVSNGRSRWREKLTRRSPVDALDPTYQWLPANIVAVKKDDSGDKLLIHYQNFDKKYDEWIDRFDRRLAEYGTMRKIQELV